jgi:hypothetical protein
VLKKGADIKLPPKNNKDYVRLKHGIFTLDVSVASMMPIMQAISLASALASMCDCGTITIVIKITSSGMATRSGLQESDVFGLLSGTLLEAINGAGAGSLPNGFSGTVTTDPDAKTITITYYKECAPITKTSCKTGAHPPTYAYAAAIRFGPKHCADDSAQEALIVIDRLLGLKPPEIDPEAVGALVRTVVLRHVHDVARRLLLEAKAIRDLSAPRPEAPDAAREAETEEWARFVREAVARLPPPLRRLAELRYTGKT